MKKTSDKDKNENENKNKSKSDDNESNDNNHNNNNHSRSSCGHHTNRTNMETSHASRGRVPNPTGKHHNYQTECYITSS